MKRSLCRLISLVVGCSVVACTSKSDANKSGHSTTRVAPIAVVSGLPSSEAVVFDPRRDVYFVSNMNGDAGVKDGNGFITRITADGVVDSLHFIQGGRNGVTLNAPMGSLIQGDTLWVLDVDVLRGFDARTGAPIRTIDLAPADDFRVVQFTPPGSLASIRFGTGIEDAASSLHVNLTLAVQDLEAARANLLARGVDVSDIFHGRGGFSHHTGTADRAPGPDPQRRSYFSFRLLQGP